jgi:hypothetical protein
MGIHRSYRNFTDIYRCKYGQLMYIDHMVIELSIYMRRSSNPPPPLDLEAGAWPACLAGAQRAFADFSISKSFMLFWPGF